MHTVIQTSFIDIHKALHSTYNAIMVICDLILISYTYIEFYTLLNIIFQKCISFFKIILPVIRIIKYMAKLV